MEQTPTLATVKEIADLLRVHPNRVYEQVKAGAIPYVKIGGAYRFDPAAVIEALTVATPAREPAA